MEARITVIDNDESIRKLLTYNLQSRGYEVSCYDYAGLNLAALVQQRPDLIILDFTETDGGTGWELLQLLKMEDTTAKIPILISTTAFQLSAEVRSYLFTRYVSVITKPFDLNVFLPLVQKILREASQAGINFSSDRILPILVVDDVQALREDLATVLQLEGYQVVTAHNGLVALETVSRVEHCLILLDIAMPIMDGFEFLRAYNRQLRPHSPVIILSGERDIQMRDLPSFVIDVILKPFEIMPLLTLVKKYAHPVLSE